MASIGKRRRLSKAQRREQRRRPTRKTWAARRQLRQSHDQLPPTARALFDTLGGAFRRATALRFFLLLAAALLTVGRHTVANLLRTLGPLVPGDASSYRSVLSRRCWSSWRLARLMAGWVIEHRVPDGPIFSAGDDTVDEHRGKKVYGKGRHRDPVRSTHSYTAFRWGHKWLVVAVVVQFALRGARNSPQKNAKLYHYPLGYYHRALAMREGLKPRRAGTALSTDCTGMVDES